MNAKIVLIIEKAVDAIDLGEKMPLTVSRRDDGGLSCFVFNRETMRIELDAEDVSMLLAYACPAQSAATPHPPPGEPVVRLLPHDQPSPVRLVPQDQPGPDPLHAIPAAQRVADTIRTREQRVNAALAHIRSIAVDGIMPSAAQYDGSRSIEHVSSGTLARDLGCTWTEIAPRLGLQLSERQRTGLMRYDTPEPVVGEEATATPGPVQAITAPLRVQSSNGSNSNGAAAKREALRRTAIAALQNISGDSGQMPSMKEFNVQKPSELPRAGDLMAALGVDHWGEMAKAAGLVWMPGERRSS